MIIIYKKENTVLNFVITFKTNSSENTANYHFPSKPRTPPQPHAIDQGSSG